MRHSLAILTAVLGAAASSVAQCAPPTRLQTTETFDGNTFFGSTALDPGPCCYFDLDVGAGLTITQLGFNLIDSINFPTLVGTTARVEMWVVDITNGLNGGTVTANIPRTYSITNGTAPGAPWTLGAAATFTIAAADVPSLTTGFSLHLNAGSYGVCLITVPNGTAPGSTAPAANMLHPLFSDVGVGSPLLVARDEILTYTGRGVRSLGFAATPLGQYQPNLLMQYVLDPNTAYTTSYGRGCYEDHKTFYQGFDGPANPAGAAPAITTVAPHMTMQPVGAPVQSYRVQAGTGTYPLVAPGSTTWYDTLAPVGSRATHVNNLTPAVSLFGGWDDSMSVLYPLPFPLQHPGGTASSIAILSNGAVFLDSTAGTMQFLHQYSQYCAGPACYAVGWGDLWPADNVTFTGGTGEIWADSDGATFVAVTWQNCQEFPNTTNATFGNSFQIVIRSSGVIDYVWGNLKNSNSAPILIGYTPGLGAADPGLGLANPRAAPDLAAVVPGSFLTGTGQIAPRLSATTRPRVGGGLTLVTTNLDPTIFAGLTFLTTGSLQPGIDLAVLGLPGCPMNVALPEFACALAPSQGGSITANVTGITVIPLSAAGRDFYAQTACLSTRTPPVNAMNVTLSQGLCLHVDIN